MEENKNNIEKVNNAAESLPEVPRDPEGKIIIDQIVTGINEKGKRIIPDKILDSYYKELPDDLVNESGTKRTFKGGILKILSAEDKDIQYQGGKALQATLKQRRTFQEAISTVLAQKARKKHIEELGLDDKADNLDMIIASMLDQVAKGNVKAAEFIEYGAGEKPTEKIDASLSAMTPEQQKILEDIKAFNSNT
jgi:hypothetical protein